MNKKRELPPEVSEFDFKRQLFLGGGLAVHVEKGNWGRKEQAEKIEGNEDPSEEIACGRNLQLREGNCPQR